MSYFLQTMPIPLLASCPTLWRNKTCCLFLTIWIGLSAHHYRNWKSTSLARRAATCRVSIHFRHEVVGMNAGTRTKDHVVPLVGSSIYPPTVAFSDKNFGTSSWVSEFWDTIIGNLLCALLEPIHRPSVRIFEFHMPAKWSPGPIQDDFKNFKEIWPYSPIWSGSWGTISLETREKYQHAELLLSLEHESSGSHYGGNGLRDTRRCFWFPALREFGGDAAIYGQ